MDQAQDFPEQFPRHRDLGQLERDVLAKGKLKISLFASILASPNANSLGILLARR